MAASADIFLEHEQWKRPLTWSALLHVGVAGAILLYSAVVHGGPGASWGSGGGGDAIGVSLVTTVPLPASSTKTQNVLANESKGLTKSLPQPVEEEKEAIPFRSANPRKNPRR